MRVAITSATELEQGLIKQQTYTPGLEVKNLEVIYHVSGIGMLHSSYAITKFLLEQKPDLIIQVGIAGCFDIYTSPGKLVAIKEEAVGDIGVEEDGIFTDLFDMKFQQEDEAPYTRRKLVNPWLSQYNLLQLDEVSGLTINEISTRRERIHQLISKYSPFTESMEGAALHYACLQTKVPFIQLRAISNYIGERDKSKWRLTEALNSLCKATIQYLHLLDNKLQQHTNSLQ